MVRALQMDSVSMFTEQTPGLQSSLAGVTALLAAAEALGRAKATVVPKARAAKKSLLFAFFNGVHFNWPHLG